MRQQRSSDAVKVMGNILPLRVHRLDKVQLPNSRPMLDRFFAGNGGGHEIVFLKPDQCFHVVF
jgi:hypothetical protein